MAMESYLNENESEVDDSERNEIRSELSKLSFEELQKLKEKLGSKVYKEAMFGAKSAKETIFKRENKNRPREVSSKIKPFVEPKKKKKVKPKRIGDPRFDRLCGEYNEKDFQKNYNFLTDIRNREKKELKKLLKKEKDPNEVKKINYLVQRMENQEREKMRRHKEQERAKEERQEQIEALQSGKKPLFKTKYEKKITQLVDKYSDLKKTGKIQKYIEKKQKKQKVKDKRKRYFEANIEGE